LEEEMAGKDKKGKPTSALGDGQTPEKKKRRMPTVPENKKGGGLKEYFKGVKIETKKVVWPTRKELLSYTIIVFVACVFFGLLIWGVDTAVLAALKQLLGITY
jgi:preprotein translocase subunit SecE